MKSNNQIFENFEIICVFSGMPWYWQIVQQCVIQNPTIASTEEGIDCGWGYSVKQPAQYTETNNQPGEQAFSLDVAHYLRKTLKFRIPTVMQPQEVYITPRIQIKTCSDCVKS